MILNSFFNFPYKNIKHDKIILFDVELLVQKNTMRAVTQNKVLNNCGQIFEEIKIFLISKFISTYFIFLTILSYCRNILKMSSTLKINSCQIYAAYPRKHILHDILEKFIRENIFPRKKLALATYTTGSQYLFRKFCIF